MWSGPLSENVIGVNDYIPVVLSCEQIWMLYFFC